MKLLFDFLPVVFFFISFKFYGIFYATAVAITTSVIQVAFYWYKNQRVETIHLITLVLIVALGGGTLLSHNPLFIKWKPTVINWVFALAFFISQFTHNRPLIQQMMENNIDLPSHIWRRLNIAWVSFFSIIGMINVYVVYHFDTNTWVNFKLFGVLGLTIIFIILQACYLYRFLQNDHTELLPSLQDEENYINLDKEQPPVAR